MERLSRGSKEYSANQDVSLRERTIARVERAARMIALVALFLAPILPLAQPVYAAGIVVDILDDDGMPEDNKCSLREAIQAANTDSEVNTGGGKADCPAGSGADIITFALAGTITLKDEININSDITIQGPIIISGGGETRIFRIGSSNGVLNLSNLTIEDGFSSGSGGAIWNQYGELNIIGSSFQNNAANGDGGAINSNSELNILMSTFAGNQAGDTQAHSGGAIHMSGSDPVQLSLSNFSGNIATGSGGAIAITGSSTEVEISDSIFSGNIAMGDDPASDGGGALYNKSDTLEIIRSAFNGNLCPSGGSGGALHIGANAAAAISDSSFNGNVSGGLSDGQGGAIYNVEALSISSCAFNGNTSSASGKGGAIYNDKTGVATIANSSFFSNNAGGEGGAICNVDTQHLSSDSTISLFNTTLSNNHAASGGGAIYNEELVLLYNSIIDEGSGTGGTCAGTGTITGDSHNLQHPGTDCGSSIPSADPLLELPNFNGGPIVSLLTQALEPGSPARDAGDDSVCAAAPVNNKDQRGDQRPLDGDGDGIAVCDIGAFEAEEVSAGYGSDPVQPGPIQFGSAVVGTTIDGSFEVFETGNMALSVGSLTLGGPSAADFNVVTAPFDIADGAPSVMVELECTPSAVGQRSATLTLTTNDADNLSVSYQLLCTGVTAPQAGYGSTPPAPGPVDFGNVIVDDTRNIKFTIFEAGTADLTVQDPLLEGVNPGEFDLVTTFPLTIVNGGPAQDVDLTCTPAAPGIQTAILTLTTNDPDNPTVSYNLTCNGYVPPDPPLEPQPPTIGVFTPYDVAISPDGNYAYVSSHFTHDLRVFTRTVASGALEFTQSYIMNTPQGVEISPDGKHVFVTDVVDDKLLILERDSSDGTVSFLDEIKEGDMVEGSGNPPILFPLDGLEGANGLAVSPDGRNIYVAGQSDDTLVVFGRSVPTGTVKYMQLFDDATSYVTGLSGVRDVTVSPDGNHVYAASHNTSTGNPGAVVLFSRDPTNGRLTLAQVYTSSVALSLGGATAVAVSPDGAQVYVAAGADDSLLIFNRNPADGTLTLAQKWSNSMWFIGLSDAHGIATNPDGSQIYVSSRGDDALAVFERDFLTGQLSLLKVYLDETGGVDGLDMASKVAVSPSGGHVYVTGYNDNEVAVFSIAKPAPILTSLDPASVVAGSSTFTLTLYGEKFSFDSVARWDGSDRTTTYVSSNELEAVINAADVAAAGTAMVDVYTPAPGGGTSNELRFVILEPDDNPVPTLRSLDPSGAVAGDPAFTMLVNGANFVAGATVQWNGSDRDTTFVSSAQLQALIPASDLATPGPAGVTVINPGPGGGTSNALTFSVEEPGGNPVPSITGLSPASVYATGASGTDLVVYVRGANFIPESQVYLDGDPRVTSYVDGAQLQVILTAGDTAFAGTSSVTVVNPEPGGGTSNAVTFSVVGTDRNLIPSIASARVDSSTVAGAAFTLVLEGAGFVSDSVIHWNGTAQATTFVSATQLTGPVALDKVLNSNGASVTVVNPPPGGGTSNTVLVAFYGLYLPTIIR
jgi:CSLREA domain-containing protein